MSNVQMRRPRFPIANRFIFLTFQWNSKSQSNESDPSEVLAVVGNEDVVVRENGEGVRFLQSSKVRPKVLCS